MKLIRIIVVSSLLSCPAKALEPGGGFDAPLRLMIMHPLYVLATDDLDVSFSVYNNTDEEQSFAGEVVDDNGNLILSGGWQLFLEELKKGEVVSSRDLRTEEQPSAKSVKLESQEEKSWRVKIALQHLVEHPGAYRLRMKFGENETMGRPFRVVERPGMPDDISLTYTPEKNSCFIGEPIPVHFTMKNEGEDEFHFVEGGDYRGANRHLRYAFTATTADGKEAVDPKPSQLCMGGLGMADPHLKPGGVYEKELPLLSYLKFSEPGKYTVKCYQSLGFGMPEQEIPEAGYYMYVYGNSFDIELRIPTAEEMKELIKTALRNGDEGKWTVGSLYHECYLAPLVDCVQDESDNGKLEMLVDGIASIMTTNATRALIDLMQDERAPVRGAVLKRLSWRLPDPRDTGRVPACSPFQLYSSEARIRDSRASWVPAFHPEVLGILKKGLGSDSLEEVSGCAYCLGALSETNAIDLLVHAADRIAPDILVSPEGECCVNRIADAASLLARLGARPCAANKESSPGRLAVWANMIRTNEEYRTGNWEDLILHMQELDCSMTRMAAIRWLPEDFTKRDRMPWKKLVMDENRQVWWHAIQIARQDMPSGFGAIVSECLEKTSDESKRRDLERLLEEIKTGNSRRAEAGF